jgi:hypothetical protein
MQRLSAPGNQLRGLTVLDSKCRLPYNPVQSKLEFLLKIDLL